MDQAPTLQALQAVELRPLPCTSTHHPPATSPVPWLSAPRMGQGCRELYRGQAPEHEEGIKWAGASREIQEEASIRGEAQRVLLKGACPHIGVPRMEVSSHGFAR